MLLRPLSSPSHVALASWCISRRRDGSVPVAPRRERNPAPPRRTPDTDRAPFPSGRPRWPTDWRGHTAPGPARWTACRVASGFVSRHRARCPLDAQSGTHDAGPSRCTRDSSASARSFRSVETFTVRFGFFDRGVGPDSLQQLLLRQQAAGVAKKHHERVEDLRRDGKRDVIAGDPLLARVDTKPPETIDREVQAFSKTFRRP